MGPLKVVLLVALAFAEKPPGDDDASDGGGPGDGDGPPPGDAMTEPPTTTPCAALSDAYTCISAGCDWAGAACGDADALDADAVDNPFCRLDNSTGCWGRTRVFDDFEVRTLADLGCDLGLVRLRPALGDLDGDADLDLVVGATDVGDADARAIAAGDGFLLYFENVGSARAPAFEYVEAPGFPFYPSDVRADDPACDDDGSRPYVVCGCDFGCRSSTTQLSPALVDLDGDGDLDIVAGQQNAYLHFFRNDGGFRFVDASDEIGFPFGVNLVAAFVADEAAVYADPAPSFGDLDGDGDLDLLLGTFNGGLHYFRNDGDATAPRFV